MPDDVLYRKSYLGRISELRPMALPAANSYFQYEKEAFASGLIPRKTKELIAIAAAHITGCPYCIDVHVAKYKKLGGTMEEIMEAVMVASAVNAGAALAHAVNALNAYEQN
ncbi:MULTISPECIES: carboxymuconolactone decarboxylase family protein [unclassified Paenibacillus]|uniref:carboxymuconolactone decarboxylase family protein n=1 Tax=unclassified Paenibacillus TaxID=185978 RepID=UPI0009AD0876|nr:MULTISPECIES: carboxymuconolactone decarboxylase family protein [unclassified Paenibacillus]MBE1443617.1 AhpD family alkylhydroperoxidase [Paenibacillus sp. OAS669]